tara:strand:+ start:2083 stop:3252 length:1170 start_codon:yes stop_codon:yes gene_type:complete
LSQGGQKNNDMANILLNLLAARSGGQLTRASAFLDRISKFSPSDNYIILKDSEVLKDFRSTKKLSFINISFGNGRFKVARRFLWENTVMPKLIKNKKIDLYLTFSHYLPNFINGIPSVVGITNLAPFSNEAINSERFFVKLKLKLLKKTILSSANKSNAIIAISKKCNDILINNGVLDKKIIVNPNGVEAFWEKVDKSDYNLDVCKIIDPFILYVSHFHYYKNHRNLIKAFSELPSKIKDTHKLVLVGKPQDKQCHSRVVALINELKLKNRVIIIEGEDHKNLRLLYQRSKLFAFPSLIENCPNILLEAMRSSCTIISSNLDPMPEFGEKNVVYFDPLDHLDIRDKIYQTISNADLRESLSRSAYKRSLVYTWDNFTLNVSKEIDKILR